MKRLCALVCVLLAASVAASGAWTPQRQQRVQWQRSESPSIKLGIRDKNADLGRYDATFVVTARRDGKRYEKSVAVEGDHFGTVDFPDDFAAFDYMQHGTQFDWTCSVNGKVVRNGRFMLATSLELLPDEGRGKTGKRKRR
jgi:hypothetical protein